MIQDNIYIKEIYQNLHLAIKHSEQLLKQIIQENKIIFEQHTQEYKYLDTFFLLLGSSYLDRFFLLLGSSYLDTIFLLLRSSAYH